MPNLKFTDRVYDVVRRIPKGQTLTYREVARLAGSPRAYRAVGNALNQNPDPKTIPCHRVVKSDGSPGGYKWGPAQKLKLLQKEKAC